MSNMEQLIANNIREQFVDLTQSDETIRRQINQALIHFATIHVRAALQKASEKVYFRDSDGFILKTSKESKELILNAYSDNNII